VKFSEAMAALEDGKTVWVVGLAIQIIGVFMHLFLASEAYAHLVTSIGVIIWLLGWIPYIKRHKRYRGE